MHDNSRNISQSNIILLILCPFNMPILNLNKSLSCLSTQYNIFTLVLDCPIEYLTKMITGNYKYINQHGEIMLSHE